MNRFENMIEEIKSRKKTASNRLDPLADFMKIEFEKYGLSDVRGGSATKERPVDGMARSKKWDLTYKSSGKIRLIVSLKSMWGNAGGAMGNRIDDLIGETANVQQMTPEIVTGYIVIFDEQSDTTKAKKKFHQYKDAIKKITIRKAPLWNQGLLEGSWFLHIDSEKELGQRVVDVKEAESELKIFIQSLLKELKLREPSIPVNMNMIEE